MEQANTFDQSALVIRLLQIGEIVERYRRNHTTDGAEGMPPHVTLLYPFLTAEEYTPRAEARLADVSATFRPFSLHVGGIRRFPGVLYLEVSPREPILHLIERLVEVFPACLPYGGTIPLRDLVPHVTLAVDPADDRLADIARAFARETARVTFERMPVEAVSMAVKASGRWRQLCSFPFGRP